VPGYYFDHRALGRGTVRGSARWDFREHRPAPSQAPHIGLASLYDCLFAERKKYPFPPAVVRNFSSNMDPDPAFKVNPDLVPNPDPGFLWPKLKKKMQLKFFFLFLVKNCNLPKVAIIRDVQATGEALPSKNNIQHFKRWILLTVFYFLGHFALLDPDSGFTIILRVTLFLHFFFLFFFSI
jgi:hypothetical protein